MQKNRNSGFEAAHSGPLVQLEERLPHKQVVPGSSPGRSIVFIEEVKVSE